MLFNILKTDPAYWEQVKKYDKIDALRAFLVWLVAVITYYNVGKYYVRTGDNIGSYASFSLAFLAIMMVFTRGENLTTIGFNLKNGFKSIVMGIVLGIVIIVTVNYDFITMFAYGFNSSDFKFLLDNFIYYFFVVALVDEIVFRGYVQTRLYGLFKNQFAAILAGAILFALLNIPFQLAYTETGFSELGFYFTFYWRNLAVPFGLHILLSLLYKRYNSIYGPIICYTLITWSGTLFL
ncbi:CPBP family intramembrane glutamic endopeptidase [Halanaerobium salsuginis]|jgi:hypothetical protein|uniref:CAAX prenyl protease 2/Lysostaphin resistance protein A-like domain-containing protein n=1 Tax=Halanaerobium salsuginis TaxID=29563 RepID=A0A1I4M7H8_9FIRM|nr:CPBP family intramembrane glutamic endopeptidase [Halanaerobium salsuginis]SFL98995.1 hypothetical protein SAMN02983006_02523 [Halanaerobium salsuginis]